MRENFNLYFIVISAAEGNKIDDKITIFGTKPVTDLLGCIIKVKQESETNNKIITYLWAFYSPMSIMPMKIDFCNKLYSRLVFVFVVAYIVVVLVVLVVLADAWKLVCSLYIP